MFQTFFGGEGGVSTNRMIGRSLVGVNYAAPIQVYYLIVAWTAIAIALMLLLTRTPLGRMANACRDNFERAQFVGYDPRMVRFVQFSLSGFFAGHRGRAVRAHLRDRHLRHGERRHVGQRPAHDLHRRRRRLRRAR